MHAWSKNAHDLWGLRPDDVDGRDFLGLDLGLPLEEPAAPLSRVLEGEPATMVELSVAAVDRRGRRQRLRLQISPLRHQDEVSGAVLVMNDVTNDITNDAAGNSVQRA